MSQPALKYYTEEEYLAFERASQERHEYYKGEIFAMSGASYKHNVIQINLTSLLRSFLISVCSFLINVCGFLINVWRN